MSQTSRSIYWEALYARSFTRFLLEFRVDDTWQMLCVAVLIGRFNLSTQKIVLFCIFFGILKNWIVRIEILNWIINKQKYALGLNIGAFHLILHPNFYEQQDAFEIRFNPCVRANVLFLSFAIVLSFCFILSWPNKTLESFFKLHKYLLSLSYVRT